MSDTLNEQERLEDKLNSNLVFDIKYAIPAYGYYRFIKDRSNDRGLSPNDHRFVQSAQMFMGMYHLVATAVTGMAVYKLIDWMF